MLFKKIRNIVFAVWMSILLLFGGMPMDFIHQFANHKDGIDPDTKGLVFHSKHHHCAFLAFSLAPFTDSCSIPDVHSFALTYSFFFCTLSDNYSPQYEYNAFSRGPPILS